MHLGPPHGVAVDDLRIAVERFDTRMQLVDLLLAIRVQRGIFRHGFRANVAEVDEATGDRQVRRRRQRRHRFGGMHRIDEHEVGTGPSLGFDQQGLEILIVAHAPGAVGTDGVQLTHPTPQGAFLHVIEQFDLFRSADNGCILGALPHPYMQGMVSGRQVLRQYHRRSGDERVVNLMDGAVAGTIGDLPHEFTAILQRDAGLRRLEDADVDQHLARLAHRVQHRGCHQP